MTITAVSGRIVAARTEPLCLRFTVAWDSGHVIEYTTHVRPAILAPQLGIDDASELVGKVRHGRIDTDANGRIKPHHGFDVVLVS